MGINRKMERDNKKKSPHVLSKSMEPIMLIYNKFMTKEERYEFEYLILCESIAQGLETLEQIEKEYAEFKEKMLTKYFTKLNNNENERT
jgi:hypothetical protein